MKVGIKRPNRRLRRGHWQAICGLLVMVSALSLVWATIASVTLWRRDRELSNATEELNDLREDVRRMEERQQVRAPDWDLTADNFLLEPPPTLSNDEEIYGDPFAVFEQELGIIRDEE